MNEVVEAKPVVHYMAQMCKTNEMLTVCCYHYLLKGWKRNYNTIIQ